MSEIVITDEAVEAAALAAFNDEWRPGDWKWDQYGSDSRYHYRARASLTAAAPHLQVTGLTHVRNRCGAALSLGQCILPSAHAPLFGSLPHIMGNGNLFALDDAVGTTKERRPPDEPGG